LPSTLDCKRLLLERLALKPGERVLELGCGCGDDARAMAQMVGQAGRVSAVDLSQVMVTESRRRGAGGFDNVDFRQADAQALPFADSSFDAIRSERVWMHIADPARAAREVARVLGPGGRVAIFDFDFDAVVIPHPDRELTRRIVQGIGDAVANGQIGRQLPGLLRAAGLGEVTLTPHTNLPPLQFLRLIADGAMKNLAKARTITTAERARWWRQLEELERRGDYFAAFNGFVVAGRKM
jgi:ubiquinone/menaquinone biosynthesis C-methylase UbiE